MKRNEVRFPGQRTKTVVPQSVGHDPFGVTYRIVHISDMYAMISNSSKMVDTKQHKINLWLGITTS